MNPAIESLVLTHAPVSAPDSVRAGLVPDALGRPRRSRPTRRVRALCLLTLLVSVGADALAEGNSSLYGLLDVYVARYKGSPGGVNSTNQSMARVDSGGLSTSRFGIQGSEDLGRGWRAAFNLSAFLRLDTGAVGRSDAVGVVAADPFWSRESSLALSSPGFGRIRVGNFGTPMFDQSLAFSVLGTSTVFAPINLLTYIGSPLSGGTGWSNQIAYDSPDIHGVVVSAAYSVSEGQGGHNAGARVAWSDGPAALSVAWQDVRKNPLTFADGTSSNNTQAWQLAGSYDLRVVKLFAHIGQIHNDGTDGAPLDVRYLIRGVGATVPVTANSSLMLAYGRRSTNDAVAPVVASAVGGNRRRDVAAIAYDYVLSRRTDVYAVWMHDRTVTSTLPAAELRASATNLAFGIRHRF